VVDIGGEVGLGEEEAVEVVLVVLGEDHLEVGVQVVNGENKYRN
jgi:hypothetical protein